jgi:hypothetical protein
MKKEKIYCAVWIDENLMFKLKDKVLDNKKVGKKKDRNLSELAERLFNEYLNENKN